MFLRACKPSWVGVNVISPDKWRSVYHNKDCTFCFPGTIYRRVWLVFFFSFSFYFICGFAYSISFRIQNLDLQIWSVSAGFPDIIDWEEYRWHWHSGEQFIFNCLIAKFSVGFAAAARERRVGCIRFWLLTESSAALAVISAAERTKQINSLVSILVQLLWNSFLVTGASWPFFKFVPCQCRKPWSLLCHQRWGFWSLGISNTQRILGILCMKLHTRQLNLITWTVFLKSSEKVDK